MAEISVPVALLALQLAPSAGAAAPYSGPKLLSVLKSGDLIHGGPGRITGTVEEKATPNLPLRRRVRLIREIDGRVIRETWSDAATGEYLFTGVSEHETYTVISYDHEHNYRAVVADNITPEVAP